jgi:hypothetical protein
MSLRTQREARALRLNNQINDEHHHDPREAARAIDLKELTAQTARLKKKIEADKVATLEDVREYFRVLERIEDLTDEG